MNAPERLDGLDLLRHAKKLLEGIEAGEIIQVFFEPERGWENFQDTLVLSEPLHLYRLKPKKRVCYVNMYPSGPPGHPTRQIADDMANLYREGCVRVEYEPGQFDD